MTNLPPTYVEGFHDLESVKRMEYRILGKTGLLVSVLSLGSGPFGMHYGTFDEEEAIKVIQDAIRKGINYIDISYWYGQGRAEEIFGKALKEIPRKAYYIGGKVGRYELDHKQMFDFSVQKTRWAIDRSLRVLGLDYFDIIQVHDIEFAPSLDIIITQTLPELSRQVAKGNARFIGITGYPLSVLKDCVNKSNIMISCVLTYCRNTIIDDTLLQYIPFFKEQNIGIINASSHCMGLLTSKGPPVWHLANESIKSACLKAAQYCKYHDVEIAKLALCHALQNKDVSTNLVGMQNDKELRMNLQCLTSGLTSTEKNILEEIKSKYLTAIKNAEWEGTEIQLIQNLLSQK